MTLFSICDIPWWLLWLLPFLVAAFLWWWWNNRYNQKIAEYEGKIKDLNARINGLDDELAACKSKRSDLEGDLAVTKGRMREMESEMKDLKANGGKSSKDGSKTSTSGNRSASERSSKLEGSGSASGSGSGDLSAISSSIAAAGAASGKLGGSASGGGSTSGKSVYAGVKSSNLQIIEGIGPKMESILKENGIDNHAALGSKSVDEIQAILDKYGDKYKIIDPKTWASQAKMASDQDFEGLIAYQKKLDAGKDNASGMTDSKLEKYLIKIGALKAFKQDDLKAIEGIGPATDKLLKENGISTWRALANTSADSIRAILSAAGSRFSLSDPTTWPKQAELAADGKFDELREYQDFLDGGKA
jgi:predicted flap endonuclease-1-like 5' DNA nuclease